MACKIKKDKMLRKLVFATNNKNKIKEVSEIVGHRFDIVCLDELGCHDDIAETGTTLEENALIKARYINQKYGVDCFSDDTGLEVDALNGEPGVHSARYAGEDKNSEANIDKLLANLDGKSDRNARFRTVVALIINGEEHVFEGKVEGRITELRHGNGGFGYDPVFVPEDKDKTFAELSAEDKNSISHRGRAIKKLSDYLNSL